MALLAALALLCCLLHTTRSGGGGRDAIVRTHKGLVRGSSHRVLDAQVDEYLGIPFARPPLGKLRFAKPVENDRWQGVLNATRRPSACWQNVDQIFGDFLGSTMWNANTDMSEDCLYLNVWTPVAGAHLLPVMVWIHGGGFHSGSSALDVYDGRQLAAAGRVVVVAVNYRLGTLGFLALPGRRDAPGNVGLHDQVAGLTWVRRNAAAFGGDPASVTLFGASAGAASVAYHLLSRLSAQLFERAILQSGTALHGWAHMPADLLLARNDRLLARLRCPCSGDFRNGSCESNAVAAAAAAIDCLRAARPDTIVLESRLDIQYVPIVDGDFLAEPPRAAVVEGRFKSCPVLVGSNADEGSQVLAYMDDFRTSFNTSRVEIKVDSELLRNAVSEIVEFFVTGQDAAIDEALLISIVQRYRRRTAAAGASASTTDDGTESNLRVLIDLVGDVVYSCAIGEWAEMHASSNATVYRYLFGHVSSQKPWGAWTGAMHGDETPFVFGEPLREPSQYAAEERLLSRQMIALWTNFARTGNPTNGSLVHGFTWPAYSAARKVVYELSLASLNGSILIDGLSREEQCAFWKSGLKSRLESNVSIKDSTSEVTYCSPATRWDKTTRLMWMTFIAITLHTH